MSALSRIAFFVLVVAVVVAVIALRCGGADGDDGAGEATATAAGAGAATATPAATRTATGTAATTTPAATTTSTAAPTSAPTAISVSTATPSPTPATPTQIDAEGVPYSLSDMAEALAPGGVVLTDLYDPSAVCGRAAVEGLPIVAAEEAASGRFAVWVLWVYPDTEAREGDWQTGQRAEPLVAGCEPPNGFVYWHENLLIWFIGFYGDDVEPASPARSREEVRDHPVIGAFLGLTR